MYPYGGQSGYPPSYSGYPPSSPPQYPPNPNPYPSPYPPAQSGYAPPPSYSGYPSSSPSYSQAPYPSQSAYPSYPPSSPPGSFPPSTGYAPYPASSPYGGGGYQPPTPYSASPFYDASSFHSTPPPKGGVSSSYSPPATFPQTYTGAPLRKALIIGINYLDSPTAKLNGCINDAKFIQYLLTTKLSFQASDIVLMTDDSTDPARKPTRKNIIDGIRWLVTGAKPGDSFFFHFSGHGGSTKDLDGDEDDGMDETILPMDYKTAGSIVDDELHRLLPSVLPRGSRLCAVMDCCHSGTGMDLPFVHFGSYPKSAGKINYSKQTQADVTCFSGCLDNQTSSDSNRLAKVVNTGVLTFTFVQMVEKCYPGITYARMLSEMQTFVKQKNFDQLIVMSTGSNVDLGQQLII
eukprot:TRINITY_DN2132_c0_g1_i1.p1 TRINITY_DN2132_c0_g1~~TRINITY_DN2132_c0_g1_i1.p1  ORF type:complete len:404 (-),score=71.82 TRINITY_DN2132_c0_g1_i1:210-1421(-)